MEDAPSYTLVIDGALVPITNLFDRYGDPVDLWEDAHSFVAGPLPNGQWLGDVTRDYSVTRSH